MPVLLRDGSPGYTYWFRCSPSHSLHCSTSSSFSQVLMYALKSISLGRFLPLIPELMVQGTCLLLLLPAFFLFALLRSWYYSRLGIVQGYHLAWHLLLSRWAGWFSGII